MCDKRYYGADCSVLPVLISSSVKWLVPPREWIHFYFDDVFEDRPKFIRIKGKDLTVYVREDDFPTYDLYDQKLVGKEIVFSLRSNNTFFSIFNNEDYIENWLDDT